MIDETVDRWGCRFCWRACLCGKQTRDLKTVPPQLPEMFTRETTLTVDKIHEPDQGEGPDPAQIRCLITHVSTLLRHAQEREEQAAASVRAANPAFRESARNLLHYLALRSFDMRDLQLYLAAHGLSSLGRTEAHVTASLAAVLNALYRLAGRAGAAPAPAIDFQQGRQLLLTHTEALLGPKPAGRSVRIMVTLPSQAATDGGLVRSLLEAGMDCARINCAHDDEPAWAQMIDHVRQASRETGRTCRILMDLAGPKLRTGPLVPGPEVVRWKPQRDLRGRIMAPARVWLVPAGAPVPEQALADAVLPVEEAWLAQVYPGDQIRFHDARGKKRKLEVVERRGAGCWAEARQTAYVEVGMMLELHAKKGGRNIETPATRVGTLPSLEQPIFLERGDPLVLHRAPVPGEPAGHDDRGRVLVPAHVACTLPEVFADLHAGEPVKFDDGKIGGVIRSVREDAVHVEITHARKGGSKLRADRSINFPESVLPLSSLTEKDLADLDFVAGHADLVGLSFVQDPKDVFALQDELKKRRAGSLGILLKIETKRGFQQLPWLLLAAMRSSPVGVMIARGDLAVECGWERMAEIQEEMLWLSEAAHVPVVWATQVLENLAKKGLPSRAEITDAAMAERAECVMLNKGPYVHDAIRMLDDILWRMQAHQRKKTATLRRLLVAKVPEDKAAMEHAFGR